MLQLVCDGDKNGSGSVTVYNPVKQKLLRAPEVIQRFGVPPSSVAELQALVGDKSDNIRGVPGLNRSVAASLLQEHGSIEGILEKVGISDNEHAAAIEAIYEFREQLAINVEITALRRDLDIPASFFSLQAWRNPLGVLARNDLDVHELNTFMSENRVPSPNIPHWFPAEHVKNRVQTIDRKMT